MSEEVKEKKGGRWGGLLAWAFVLALLAILAVQLSKSQKSVISKGETAPAFTLETFEGEEIKSADLIGKIVVVNFWASWCKPCEQEAAELQTAWEMYQDSGDVVFLGVDYVDTTNEALAYMEKFEITYPSGPDLGTRISQGFRIIGVPETFFINQDGEVAYAQIGPFESLEQITRQIDLLLGE